MIERGMSSTHKSAERLEILYKLLAFTVGFNLGSGILHFHYNWPSF